jgi:hypothetical protein
MIKFILKVALSVLIAHATWRIGTAYVSHYRFKDAAREVALTPRATDAQLRERIMELASENDAPLEEENLNITRDVRHILMDASYVRSIDVLPGFPYAWHFAWSIDVVLLPGATASPGPTPD